VSAESASKSLAILGSRGIPARYRGFETFAQALALHLVGRGWRVTVYCQEDGGNSVSTSEWRGVRLVHIPTRWGGSLGTIAFDWASVHHAARHEPLILTLGYNTAAFCALYRLYGRRNVINMDGIEWMRGKWSPAVRAWFWLNERLACWIGDQLIADHPEIERHLATRAARSKITMIPYGADLAEAADAALLAPYGLSPGRYCLVVGHPQRDNSTLEMVSAFSRERRGVDLAILCNYDPDRNAYHRAVMDAAGPEVRFLGGIYDEATVRALQFHSLVYLHGHQVGGTNPSLLEALGAGCSILAHDNAYVRWVAGRAARYFHDEPSCATELSALLADPGARVALSELSRARAKDFAWEHSLAAYERLLSESV